jgi:hypothetical protein
VSDVGKKPSFKQVRTNEIVVPKGTDITVAGTITALDVSGISFVRLTAATELQGIVAPESPANDGKLVTITNASASDLFIRNESSGATAENRIVTGAGRDLRITVGASFTAAYDIASSRWGVTASSADVNVGRLDIGVGTLALSSEDVSLTPDNVNASLIEVTAGAASTIRSVDTVNTGNIVVFTNKTGATVQVKDEDLGATATNRIRTGTGGPLTIQNNASIMLSYSNDRWYVVGGTGTGGGAVEQVSQTGIGVLANYPVGTPLYVDATAWNKASATAANTAEVAGLISRRLNDDLAEVALAGEVSEVTSAAFIEGVLPTRGSVVFLSTTSGYLTVSDTTTIGYVSKPIGIIHNVNGSPTPTSVDIMFYNQRGIVVGSVNARTQINLNGSVGSPTVTPIQNVSAYEAGEIAGWINIDATTDYSFYFQTQFAKIPNTSNYNIAVPQTVGSTPPVGFSVDVVAGVVQVTLPALAGFVSAYANFALNAPAVGTSLPLSVNSTSVYTTYKAVTAAYNIVPTDSLIVASGATTYAVTLPTAVGATGTTYTIKSDMNAGVFLTVNTTGGQLIDSSNNKILLKDETLSVVSNGTKWINLSAPANEGRGIVPLGSVIAVGNVAGWALPTTGQIKDGYALCDGQSFPAGSNPLFTGTMPNLTDDRFLNGSTTVGGTGGSTSKTTTGVGASFNKNVLNSDQIAHNHKLPFLVGTTSGGGGIIYGFASAATSGNGLYGNSASPGGTITAAIATIAGTTSASFAQVSDSNTATVSWNSVTVNASMTQGTISDIRPKYFSVVYLMRVV